jgi:hypothetical protein
MGQAMMMRRGGGATAKLKITAYDAYASLPSSTDAYDIGVITTAAIGDVYATASAPAAPASGDIWIRLGAQSTQPILIGKGMIELYPRAVYQYISGVWVIKPAYVYSGTAWVIISLYIYNAGTELLSPVNATNQGYSYNSVTITKQAAAIKYQHAAQSGRWVWTDNTVDITDAATLNVRYTASYITGYGKYLVIAADPGNVGNSTPNVSYAMAALTLPTSNVTNGVASLDVSAHSGNVYCGVYFYNPSGYTEYIYDLYLGV